MSESIVALGREEVWLPVLNYEGVYEVSNQGQVRSLDRVDHLGRRVRGRLLKPWVAKRSDTSKQTMHQLVDLNNRGRRQAVYVHTLVLNAFVGVRPDGMEACHTDGDPANNRATNLRWDTHAANMADVLRHGRHNMLNRSHCPRGHELEPPNLVPSALASGKRACHACALARSYAHTHGASVSKVVADRYHAELIQGIRQ